MIINEKKKDDLKLVGQDGGLRSFESHLGREIYLPPDRKQWPNIKFIRAANKYRDK